MNRHRLLEVHYSPGLVPQPDVVMDFFIELAVVPPAVTYEKTNDSFGRAVVVDIILNRIEVTSDEQVVSKLTCARELQS